jgi:hypothetical protein
MRTTCLIIVFNLALSASAAALADEIDWTKVDTALGKTASVQGEVHRYGIPRTDLQVTLDGVAIKPALALGGWLAFEPIQEGAVVMGDLVLTETEVNPVNPVMKARSMAASISSQSRARSRSPRTACRFHQPWALPSRSTSSPPAEARQL